MAGPPAAARRRGWGVAEGAPFGSVAAGGLSRLAVNFLKMGIFPERIAPGKPQQNGRHERLHLTLKREATSPPSRTIRAQAARLARFRKSYNHERPHEALGQIPPAAIYAPSQRTWDGKLRPPDLSGVPKSGPGFRGHAATNKKFWIRVLILGISTLIYPGATETRAVRTSGIIKWRGAEPFISEVLTGERVGIFRTGEDHYEVYFGPILLGHIDRKKRMNRIKPRRPRNTP